MIHFSVFRVNFVIFGDMIPTQSIELAIFAINSALRASENLKKGYANHLLGKSLTIPLPKYDPTVKETTIEFFFNREGKIYLEDLDDLKNLHTKAATGNLSESDLEKYRQYYFAFQENQETHWAVFKLKQWQNSSKPASLFQLLAGQLVAIATDYFQKYPDQNSSISITLKSFFEGLDKIPFESGDFDSQKIAKVVIPHLFLASAEFLSKESNALQLNPKSRILLAEATHGIGKFLLQHSANEELTEWGKLIWFAIAKNAAEIGISKIQLPLVSEMAALLLKSILQEKEASFTLTFQIESIIKSTLLILSKYKNLYQLPGGFQGLFSEILYFFGKVEVPMVQIPIILQSAAEAGIAESENRKTMAWTIYILKNIADLNPESPHSDIVAPIFLQGLTYQLRETKNTWADFILKNYLQKLNAIQKPFKSYEEEQAGEMIKTITRFYLNEIYAQPITPGNSIKTIDYITKKLADLPKPFPHLNEEKLLQWLSDS